MKHYLSLVIIFTVLFGCTKSEPRGDPRRAENPAQGFCGEQLRITNGKTCEQLSNSSIALLQIDIDGTPAAICTGALISSTTVVTAAHCLDRTQGITGLLVGFPESKTNTPSKNYEVHRVKQFIAHPDYDSVPGNPYDVGLVILENPVETRQAVPLIGRSAQRAQSGVVISIY